MSTKLIPQNIIISNHNTNMIYNQEGIEFLNLVKDNSIDLILTDPPYIISKESGMNKFVKEVAEIDASGKNKKTEEDWVTFKAIKDIQMINIEKIILNMVIRQEINMLLKQTMVNGINSFL